MNIFKKWFSKQSPPVSVPTPNKIGNLNGLYVPSNKDIKSLGNKVNAIQQALDSLPPPVDLNDYYTKSEIDNKPYAVKNADNNFSTSQTIRGHLNSNGLYKNGSSQNIVQIKNQTAKNANVLFEQPNAGYRNHCSFNINHKYSNTPETTLFSIITKNTSQGVFFQCENNQLSFENDTIIDNVATPTSDKQVANKKYVDNAVANSGGGVDLSNVVKTNESANMEGALYFFGNPNGVVGFAGKAQYSNASYEPGEDNELTPKSYVDKKVSEINRLLGDGSWKRKKNHTDTINTTVDKKDIVSGLYGYKIGHAAINYTVSIGGEFGGDTVYYRLTILDANSRVTFGTVIYYGSAVVDAEGLIRVSSNNKTIWTISDIDLKPGTSGSIGAQCNILIEIWY